MDVSGDPASYSVHQIDHLGASAVDVQASTVEAWASDLRAIALGQQLLLQPQPLPLCSDQVLTALRRVVGGERTTGAYGDPRSPHEPH